MVDTALKDHGMKLRCPNPRCRQEISLDDFRTIVQNDPKRKAVFEEILLKKCLDLAAGRKQCPGTNCPVQFINDANSTETRTCEKCKERYCAACLVLHPRAGMTCTEAVEEQEARLAGKNALTALHVKKNKDWEKQNSKPCPHCKIAIQKNGGCPHVTCKCTREMCYMCGSKWWETGHTADHFWCPVLRQRGKMD